MPNTECVIRAVSFLKLLASFSQNETFFWTLFDVSVSVNSGVEFYRFATNGQTSLTFRPDETQ